MHQLRDLVGYAHEGHDGAVPDHDGVFSVSTGILLSASMHMLISYSDPADSASVVSLINFTGYVGSTVVSIAMSTIANTLALSTVLMVGFASRWCS